MDFSFISNFFNDIILFVQYWIDFLMTGVYNLLTDFTVFILKSFMIMVFDIAIFFINFSKDITDTLINELDLSTRLNDAYGGIDSKILYFLTMLKIPECVNNILSGLAAGFLFKVIPGI